MSTPKKVGIIFLIVAFIMLIVNRMKNEVLTELMEEDE